VQEGVRNQAARRL